MITGETIAALATPPGVGGVGIVRVSGPGVRALAIELLASLPEARRAIFRRFLDSTGAPIDEGIALFFPAPHSFTGEDVLELQGHGGPVVMDLLLQRCLECGARIAQPGEFSQRAFLNGRLDLAQAEAVADLIESGTAAAARLALRSLEGEFSQKIHKLVEAMIGLRLHVEAALDFPEEEIDFLSDKKVSTDLREIRDDLARLIASARLGRLMRDGLILVIAGLPNAGKSSLLNALSQRQTAIVTEIPGTTRDLLRERIQLDGIPLHLIDTAGLRDSDDKIEQEGVRRARGEIEQADRILWVYDSIEDPHNRGLAEARLPAQVPLTLIRNKIDIDRQSPALHRVDGITEISLSAREGLGMDLLRTHLRQSVGYHGQQEGAFIARRRHLDALKRASEYLHTGEVALLETGSGELLAEDLRQAQQALSEITGEFSSDDLLGRIFSSFCIGK